MRKTAIVLCSFSAWLFASSSPWFAKVLAVDAEAYASSLIQTADGGYLIGGEIDDYQATNPELFLAKLSADGSLKWAKIYVTRCGGFSFLIQTKDRAYAIGGYVWYPLNVKSEFLLVKLRPDGSVDWARSYGGQLHDEASSLIQTKDGGYLLVGNTRSFGAGENDILVIKTDSRGAVSWAKTYGGEGNEIARSAIQVDDGYVLAGLTNSFGAGGNDILVLKINEKGSLKWAYAYGGKAYEEAFSMVKAGNKGYCLAGWTESFAADDDRDALVISLKTDGSLRWARRIGLSDNWEEARSLAQTRDKGFVLAGFADIPIGGNWDFLVFKLNESGELAWAKTHDGNWDRDIAASVIQADDASLVVAGTTLMNFALLKLSPDGGGPKCMSDYLPEATNIQLVVSPAGISVKNCSVFTDPQDLEVRTPESIESRNICE